VGRYLLRGLLQAVVLVILVSIVVFGLIHAAPGGPGAIMADNRLSPAEIERMRENLGFDKPLPVQYLQWAKNLLTGDFGISYADGRPVLDTIQQRVPNTLILAGTAFLLALLVAIPVGVITGARAHSKLDNIVSGVTFVAMSVPVFWVGIIGIILFSVTWHMLPSSGMYTINQGKSLTDLLKHLVMPAIVLSLPTMAMFTRFVRVSVVETLQRDYVRTARAKGLSPRTVMYRHVLRTALMPIITIVGLNLPAVVTGAAVTESVFGWPGMGRLVVDSATTRDYPVVMAVTVLVACTVVLINLLTDVLYAVVDPRVTLR
jgi:peptide/nickel transport system permease protein